MKILSIEILNNKLVRVFRMVLKGKNLEIAGDTGTGKTTAVSALWDILEKGSETLTKGEKNGSIKVKLGNGEKTIVAKRTQTAKTNSISITDSEGDAISITDLKKMISSLAVNPHDIINLKPTALMEALLKAANLEGEDISELDKQIAFFEEDRLDAHRDMQSLNPGEEPERAESVSSSELLQKISDAEDNNDKIEELETSINSVKNSIVTHQTRIEELQDEIKEREELISSAENKLNENQAELDGMTFIDTEIMRTQLKQVDDTNRKALAHENWTDKKRQYDEAKNRHKESDPKVTELKNKKKSILDNAKFPLPELSIEEGQVMYKGCLLRNLGESEQMLVCAALAVEDIKAHPIRVVRMDGVESMSEKDFKQLQELFNGHDIQVLSTRVSRGDISDNEIVIVNGVYTDGTGEEKETEPKKSPAPKAEGDKKPSYDRNEIPI